ncbi:hypothetical protein [Arsenicicoccus dermatophilus]|uniref:hypothetical protein n=1 Tax=Arsenicicoccus dermatophilus TaxID=1076331 RepID=UPI001F4C8C78|nr:hypothetical protein [Arsenicicoccus dermatophilus]MCH8611530.1 hypothetical protein [Arsenicicoccus dermatophilus]
MSTQPRPRRFAVRQRITMLVNRYEIRELDDAGNEGALLAFAQQKRFAFKEQVTFYADEAKTQPVFSFRARQRIDLAATYDITDAQGQALGWFRKDFAKSLLRSTWHLGTADGLESTGTERNQGVALARRLFEILPVLDELPIPWVYHFDFTANDGTPVLGVERKISVRDRYVVELPTAANGWQLDWRCAAAMAVALDALQAR